MEVERLQREYDIDVTWLPYELHPETPAEGRVRERPKDPRADIIRGVLRERGETLGIHFQQTTVVANSRKSLEAAEFARDEGREAFERLHRGLFRAYFEDGANIGLPDVLERIVADCGLDVDRMRAELEAGTYSQRVSEAMEMAREAGVASTPTFVINGKFAVVGAQQYDVFEKVMDRLGVPRRAGAGEAPA